MASFPNPFPRAVSLINNSSIKAIFPPYSKLKIKVRMMYPTISFSENIN
jgi:hypothetical protein